MKRVTETPPQRTTANADHHHCADSLNCRAHTDRIAIQPTITKSINQQASKLGGTTAFGGGAVIAMGSARIALAAMQMMSSACGISVDRCQAGCEAIGTDLYLSRR